MKKIYTIEVTETNETSEIHRTNDGFSSTELLGYIELIKHEILEQMKGTIKPDVVKRTVIEE